MQDFLTSKAVQQLSHWSIHQLKEFSNVKGLIFVVVNELGQIITTRKTNGSAYRLLEKRYLLKDHPAATEKLFVVVANTKELIEQKVKNSHSA